MNGTKGKSEWADYFLHHPLTVLKADHCAAWIILSLNKILHYSMKNILKNSAYYSSALMKIFYFLLLI